MVAEPLAAEVVLLERVRLDHRPHRAVEDHDPLGEDLVQEPAGPRLAWFDIMKTIRAKRTSEKRGMIRR